MSGYGNRLFHYNSYFDFYYYGTAGIAGIITVLLILSIKITIRT